MKKSRVMAGVCVAVLSVSLAAPTFANASEEYFAAPDGKTIAQDTAAAAEGAYEEWKNEWQELSRDWTQVAMTPGKNETQRNFAWYSRQEEPVSLKYGKKADLSDAIEIIPEQSETTQTDADGIVYKSNRAVIENLEKNTTYYYQVDEKEIASFATGDSEQFCFIFVGDPQIGSSNGKKAKKPENLTEEFYQAQYNAVENDTFNWNHTLNQAMEKSGQTASFILSAGDQIQTNAKKVADTTVSETEYAGYLSPEVLKKLPVATTVGNHDADNANYQYHFYLPNLSDLGSNGIVGGDYSFTYGDALFIMLNTQDTNIAEHKLFIEQAVKEDPDCTWRIVTLHQDIYGSAEHSNEPEIINLRYALVPIFQENDIDVVLTGHDHAYSRSELLKDGVKTITYTEEEFEEQFEKDICVNEEAKDTAILVSPGNISSDTAEDKEQRYIEYLNTVMDKEAVVEQTKGQETVTDAEGILYLTAGSSSGSKYYDLVARQQTYIAARWQEDVPTYSLIEVDKDSLTIHSYRTDTNEAIDKQITLHKSMTVDSEQINTDTVPVLQEQVTQTVQPEEKSESQDAPKTADKTPVVLWSVMSVVCIFAAISLLAQSFQPESGEQNSGNGKNKNEE